MGFSVSDLGALGLGPTVVLALLAAVVIWTLVLGVSAALSRRDFFARLRGAHVFITGGSQGLGLELAKEFARRGAKVSVVARNKVKLDAARAAITSEIEALSPDTGLLQTAGVTTLSCDVTDASAVQKTVDAAVAKHGPIALVIPCAGSSLTGYFLTTGVDRFWKSMKLNYLGTVHVLKAVVPDMAERKQGCVLLVSSAMALTAYAGYSTYVPTKWALRGLGDALNNELSPYKIRIAQAYPPGMNTPGFEVEEVTKPGECKAIEADETVYEPKDVASSIVHSLASGVYHIDCGDFGIGLLTRLSAGMSVRYNLAVDMLLMPLLVIVSKVYTYVWNSEVNNAKWDGVRPQPPFPGMLGTVTAGEAEELKSPARDDSLKQRKRSLK